jgi:pimeloyl-ACP methyl ester carboxylesterase
MIRLFGGFSTFTRHGAGTMLVSLGAILPNEGYRARLVARRGRRMKLANATLVATSICIAPWTVAASFPEAADTRPRVSFVHSKDGARIAVECAGQGPTLLIVHGGTGDRRRWTPLLPLFASHFTVCAMDRRGHGDSEAGANYSLTKEFEDVAAVAESLPGTVSVLGHSIGGLCALEAAFLTNRISRLILYEPPLQDLDHTEVADRMEAMIRTGKREQALIAFLRDIVMLSPDEISAMKRQPSWSDRIAGIDIQLREIRAANKYRFDPDRVRTLQVPTLLLTGDKTASPQLKQAIASLMDTLPNRTLVVFEGQEHNAMDHIPRQFAETVARFLRATH